jgi:hypothetical protein
MNTRFILAAYVLIVAAIALPVISLHTLPFTDLPIHLAEATILKYAADPTCPLSQSYSASRLSWFQPSIGHAVFCSWFASVESANRILYVTYCFAIPLSMLSITRMCAGNWAVAFMSVLTVWNYSALWGFTGFTLGIPLVLLSVSQQLHCFTNRAWVHVVFLGLLFILLYWMHALLFLFALCTFITIALFTAVTTSAPTRQMLGRSLLAPLPATGLLAIWVCKGSEFSGGGTVAFLKSYYLHAFVPSVWHRMIEFVTADWQAIAYGIYGKTIALLVSMVVVIPVVVCLCRFPYRIVSLTASRTATLGFVGAAFVCFALLPPGLPGQPYLYQRFSVFCYLAVICVLSWALPVVWPRFQYKMVILLAIAGYAALWGHYFWSFRTVDDDFETFSRTAPDTKRQMVGYLICEPKFRGRAVLIHYNNYEIIWNRNPTPTCVGNFRFGMISQVRPLPQYYEWITYMPSGISTIVDMYSVCKYLAVQGKHPYDVIKQRADFIRVHEIGTWCLFKKVETADQASEVRVRKLGKP